jgi:hypothetical protein
MNVKKLWRYTPATGPVLSLLLIGIVLLSALLYYRAVKIQRFLEPALALSQPRNEFAKNINMQVQKEFGPNPVLGLKIKSSSMLVDSSLLFTRAGNAKVTAREDIQKLSRILLALMRDEHTRSEISLVMIIGRYPFYGVTAATAMERLKALQFIGLIEDSLFQAEPELGSIYAPYFTVSAIPTPPDTFHGATIEFRIVPSEFLHIEVLDKLEKYSY